MIRKISIATIVFSAFAISTALSAPPPQSIIVNINGIEIKKAFGAEETKIISRETGDHHCSSNCKGEPTRTPYRIDYNVSPSEYKIVSSKVECGGGTCGYSGNVVVKNTENAAWATFDVWSRPTIWTLSVTVKPVLIVAGDAVQIDSDQVEEGKTFIVKHDPTKHLDVEIEANLPKIGLVKMSPDAPFEPYFKKIGTSLFGGVKTYTIQYLGDK